MDPAWSRKLASGVFVAAADLVVEQVSWSLDPVWMPHLTPSRFIKERFQPATSPRMEEIHLLHEGTG